MQSIIKKTLLLLLAVCLLSCGTLQCLAEPEISNRIIGGDGNNVVVSPAAGQDDGLELILSTGEQNVIAMPNFYSYRQPTEMYIDAPGDHSVYVYRDLTCDREKLMPFAFEGQRVTEVARQHNGQTELSCIVYRDEDYRLHAGWVHGKYLTGWFPGAVKSIGSAGTGTMYAAEDPVLSWGRDYFVNTKQRYMLLSTPIPACVQFRLNYQVTSRGGVRTEDVLGPRTIYVNDGNGWTSVGQFEYAAIESVLVTVNLLQPTELRAVAVIPSCSRPDRFSSRQSVQDVLTAGAGIQESDSGSGTAEVIWETEPAATVITETPVPAPRRGSIVTYGVYEQENYRKGGAEPIEWIVLDVQDSRILLISRYALDCASYCSRRESVAWETSGIRAWLNDPFLNAAFSTEEQKYILVTEVDNSRSQGYIHYDGDGGNNTLDQIFLLSYAEAWKYFYQNSDRACKPTKAAVKRGVFESSTSGNCPWWLRSPGYTTDYVAAVDVDGNRGGNIKYGQMGVRPAMWVDIGAARLLRTVTYHR